MLRRRASLLLLAACFLMSNGCLTKTNSLVPQGAAVSKDLVTNPTLDPDAAKGIHWRPLSDFFNAQSFQVLFNGDSPNRGPFNTWVDLDFLGLRQKELLAAGAPVPPTTFTGTVKEQNLKGGVCEVTVSVHFSGALVSGHDFDLDPDYLANLAFGHDVWQIIADHSLTAALASGSYEFVFTIPSTGAPLPSFSSLALDPAFAGRLRSVRINCSSFGECRAILGVPDGSPGKLSLNNVAPHLDRPLQYKDSWLGYPCGIAKIQPLGK